MKQKENINVQIGSGGFVKPDPIIYISKKQIKKQTTMEFLQKYYPILLAFISFLFSVTLWFSGMREEGLFVGIWVPSILSLANFFNSTKS